MGMSVLKTNIEISLLDKNQYERNLFFIVACIVTQSALALILNHKNLQKCHVACSVVSVSNIFCLVRMGNKDVILDSFTHYD